MFNLDNQFWQMVRTDWMVRDPIMLAGGAAATVLNLLRGARNRQVLAVALLGLFPLYYLARGGLVFNFYIVFAIPFFCLNIAALLAPVCARIPGWAGAVVVATIAGALVVTYWQAGMAQPLYANRSSEAGRAAIAWIRQSLPAQSVIVADDSFWPDLREPALGAPAFPNVHSHWKVGSDPEVREGIFHNDWRRVDYLIMTPGLAKTFAEANNRVALEALQHAHLIQRWVADGAEVELWQVDKPSATSTGIPKTLSSASLAIRTPTQL